MLTTPCAPHETRKNLKFQLTTAAAPANEQPSSEVTQAKKYSTGTITALAGIPNTNVLTGELKLNADRYDVESGTIRYRSKMNGADVFNIAVNPIWLGKVMPQPQAPDQLIKVWVIHESYNNQEDEGTTEMYCKASVGN